jgi:hypothetical protein
MSYHQKKPFIDSFSTPITPKPKAKEQVIEEQENESLKESDINNPLKKDHKELLPKIASMLGKVVQGKQYSSDLNHAFDKLTGIAPIVTPSPFEAPRDDFHPKPSSELADFDFSFTPPNAEIEIEVYHEDLVFEPIFPDAQEEPIQAQDSSEFQQNQTPMLSSNELLSNESTIVETDPQEFHFDDPFANLEEDQSPRAFHDFDEEISKQNKK